MILSDKDLRERIIQDPQEVKQARDWWEKGEWAKIQDRVLIDPIKTYALGTCSYDLSVGEEYLSLKDPEHARPLKEGEHLKIGPGETVLILTGEYIGLPRNVMAMIVPRARWIWEGTCVYVTRVDPTWYGKLLIGFTNLAKNPVVLSPGEEFCTCYFMEASETNTVLTKDRVPFLGRTKIEPIHFTHVREQRLLPADRVTESDIDKVVDLYGWPWDVARGMFYLNKRLLEDYIDKDKLPELTEKLTSKISVETHKEVGKLTSRMFYALVGLFAVLAGLFGWLIYLLSAFLSSRP